MEDEDRRYGIKNAERERYNKYMERRKTLIREGKSPSEATAQAAEEARGEEIKQTIRDYEKLMAEMRERRVKGEDLLSPANR